MRKNCIATSWQRTGGRCLMANVVLLRLLLVSALSCLAWPASAALRSWTGDGPLVGGFKYWSHPDNWSPNGAPQNGDELSFHEYNILAGSTTMINDLPDLTVHSMSVWYQADFFTHEWKLYGNTLGITHDILLYFTTGQDVRFYCGLRLEGNVPRAAPSISLVWLCRRPLISPRHLITNSL